MRVGIISDVHSNFEALEEVLEEMDSKRIDEILSAGDLVGYGASPNEVVEKVRERDIESVKGNHDKGIESSGFNFNHRARKALIWNRRELRKENKEFVQRLPEKMEKQLEGKNILVVHGSPRDPINEYIYRRQISERWMELNQVSDYDIIVMGHTHVPFKKKIERKGKRTLVMNPGSVGQPRNHEPGAYYSILDLEKLEAEIFRIEYDIDKAADKIKEAGLPFSLADRLYRGV